MTNETIFTFTTDDDCGTRTNVFFSKEERDRDAFQWMLAHLTQKNKDHAPYIGLAIPDAYKLFEIDMAGYDYLLWVEGHNMIHKEPYDGEPRSDFSDGSDDEESDSARWRAEQRLKNNPDY